MERIFSPARAHRVLHLGHQVRRRQTEVNVDHGLLCLRIAIGRWFFLELLNVGVQLPQLALVTAREDGESAPGLGIEVFVVDMKGRGVAFTFPLVAAPELKEALDPLAQLNGGVVRKAALHRCRTSSGVCLSRMADRSMASSRS